VSVLGDSKLEALLDALHAQSDGQTGALSAYFERRVRDGTLDWNHLDEDADRFFADKMVALEKDKAEVCYALCRALRARRVVEAGTSYGVSTLYLAAAARNNGGGVVVATEYEPAKAKAARANFAAAGLADHIDLREGDLRESLKTLEGPIDFLLCDIWTEMAAPALRLVAPHMRPGAIAVADNTNTYRRQYADYFAVLAQTGFTTLTLPFDGGLEMSVKG
jgi:predicted O-methyltransferase YrrM